MWIFTELVTACMVLIFWYWASNLQPHACQELLFHWAIPHLYFHLETDRVLLSSPKLILNLLCSPRMLQRIVMLQISRNYSCTYDRAHLILFSPSSQFSVHGLLHLWVDSAWGRQAGNPELGPLLVQPEFTCAKCLPSDENSATRLGFCFSFTDHRTSFLKIWFPFQ